MKIHIVSVEIQLKRCDDKSLSKDDPAAVDEERFVAPKEKTVKSVGGGKQANPVTLQSPSVQEHATTTSDSISTPTWRSKRLAEKRRVADSHSDTDSISMKSGGSDGNITRKKMKPVEETESKITSGTKVGDSEEGSTPTSKRLPAKRISIVEKSLPTPGYSSQARKSDFGTRSGRRSQSKPNMPEEESEEEMIRGADDESDASFVEESDSDDEESPAMEFEFDEGSLEPTPAVPIRQPQSAQVWNLRSQDSTATIPIRMTSVGAEAPRVDPDKEGVMFKLGMEGSYRVNLKNFKKNLKFYL